jgi:hypothetical protein
MPAEEVCGCPCTDPTRACRGRPATTLSLRESGGVTLHRPRRPCLELTFDPAVAFPDLYRAAVGAVGETWAWRWGSTSCPAMWIA